MGITMFHMQVSTIALLFAIHATTALPVITNPPPLNASYATGNSNSSMYAMVVATPPKSQAAVDLVSKTSYEESIKALTTDLLAGFKSIKAGDSAGETLVAVAGAVVTNVLALVPVVGPLLSGLVALFWPPSSPESLWDQIKDIVDVKIGEAMREVQVTWVAKELSA